MLENFFQLSVIPTDQLIGFYNGHLVLLSIMVAVFASYIALDLTARLRDLSNTRTSALLWLVGGAVAMGNGIWSMHFIGMLSFTIPGITLRYDIFWTILSLFVAIFASGFALLLLKASEVRIEYYIAGGVILGLAIASMHYTGMEAMLITLNIRYLPLIFLLSILIAIISSEAALWFALKSTRVISRLRNRIKIMSAVIMGFAICGMHYTGMAASIFTLCNSTPATGTSSLDPTLLSTWVAGVTFIILGIAFFASNYKEAANQLQLEKARELGMAEISASVLHNVGNVLNSVSVSASILSEQTASSKLSGLEKLSALFNEHKKDLPQFLATGASQDIIDYINKLTDCWKNERQVTNEELLRLKNHVDLIKEIIITQQDISKSVEFEKLILINELIDEVILITGLNLKKEIKLVKKYEKIAPLMVDKVKLLQVLLNLIRNAKDSVLDSHHPQKIITISTNMKNNKVIIEIEDNGKGILSKNINRIFNYGFTTKATGHGFGLHTSAIAIAAMGGDIQAKSNGLNKGATFTIRLPYKK